MALDRRAFLKLSAGAAGSCLLSVPRARAEGETSPFSSHMAMLNDLTRCVGCRACQSSCKDAFGLARTGPDPRYDLPMGLEAGNYTVIKQYKQGDESSYIKRQCMHCNYPSCVSACPVGALEKRSLGAVTYDADKCIGCRYCMIACPFNVPRFEWDSPTPEIRKCNFCYDRITQGEHPVCARVCPAGAITYGRRDAMVQEAHRRIAANPDGYIAHVYGEHEVGGTSVVYLAGLPFAKLGLRPFDDEPLPELVEKIQHGIFKWFLSPFALLGLLGLMRMSNLRCEPDDENCIEE